MAIAEIPSVPASTGTDDQERTVSGSPTFADAPQRVDLALRDQPDPLRQSAAAHTATYRRRRLKRSPSYNPTRPAT